MKSIICSLRPSGVNRKPLKTKNLPPKLTGGGGVSRTAPHSPLQHRRTEQRVPPRAQRVRRIQNPARQQATPRIRGAFFRLTRLLSWRVSCDEALTMRCLLSALLLLLLMPAARAQVSATHPFQAAIARARSLEAGAVATDVPHHVHYDLKLYNHKGKLTKGTWDIWRDPLHFTRTDLVAGDFHYTHIEDLVHVTQWRHFNTLMPLKVYDLRQNYLEPVFAVAWFEKPGPRHDVHFDQIQGSPFDCTNELVQMRICFDPLAHVLAFAQMFNQTVTWENWQPIGTHSIPQRFRIYDAGRIMVEATGHAEIVKTFPPDLFTIPPGQPDMGEPEEDGATPHKVIGTQPVHLDQLYGNVLVQVQVDAEGKVHKVDMIDADDDDLVHDSVEFAKHLTFAPALTNGVAAPFDQYIYLRYAIGAP